MADKRWDLILVGAGLANSLIAWRLRQLRPALRLLLLESGAAPGGNHTWSFHDSDLTPEQYQWVAPFVAHHWQGYDVQFPALTRTLPGGYSSVTTAHFAALISQQLGEALRTNTVVTGFDAHQVTLANGGRLIAHAVIDGRGYQTDPHLITGAQAFVGQQWQLSAPHGLTRPCLMDATVEQSAGYRFVYTLPLSATELLIEDTHYQDQARFDPTQARANIRDYARRQGWRLATLQREEQGILPITLAGQHRDFWRARVSQPCSGLRAGLFHATTGYSLPQAVALADAIAHQPDLRAPALCAMIEQRARQQWRQQRFFRLVNRMLFLAGRPEQRWRVMQRFYHLDDRLIARFYAGRLTLADKARILCGKPPVPLGEALLAICKYHPRLRAHQNE